MARLFSPSAKGFFDTDVHASIPEDAVEVDGAEYADALTAQEEGKVLSVGLDGKIAAVDPEQIPAAPIRAISPLSFRHRLSLDQRKAITLAASQALDAGDATLQTFLDDLHAARYVNLDNAATLAGVAAMQAAGLITAEEAALLLADGQPGEV